MVRYTKYMTKMLEDIKNGAEYVSSPDKKVKIRISNIPKFRDKYTHFVKLITVYHYDTLILEIMSDDSLNHIGINGYSFTIFSDAYSVTDARIINQVLDKYVPGFIVHSCKGEVIVD